MHPLRRVLGYVARYKLLATATLVCAIFSTSLVVVFPKATQVIIDDAIRGGRPDLLVPTVLLALGAFFLRDFLNAIRILLNNSFEQKVIFDLRSDLYSHMQRLPLEWFDNRSTGDLMTRIIEDVTAMERVLIDGIEQGTVAILQVAIVAAMCFYFNSGLALAALSPIPLLAAGAMIYTMTARQRYRKVRKATSAMNALLHDNLAGIRQIKTYVRENEEHQRFNSASNALRQATLTVMRAWASYNPTMTFLASVGLVLVLGVGGQKVLDGQMEIGELAAFLTLVGFLYEPIGRLHQLNQLAQSGRAAAERVFEIMDVKEEAGHRNTPESSQRLQLRGEVEFRDVSFSYSTEVPVLKHLTLHAQPGETIALVGATGAGKSTLVNLITRFYEFDSGEILIDGTPLCDYPKSQLREAVGMVTQESFLFNGTIRENLAIGNAAATEAEMLKALDAANARGIIDKLPDQLDTNVGERGVKLSVGEKQRISIARALLKDPPILILDEATASVDTATEKLIQQALDHLMRNRTTFVIAHRLSTISSADQILVMDHGRIVERGRHQELLTAEGLYAQLAAHSGLR